MCIVCGSESGLGGLGGRSSMGGHNFAVCSATRFIIALSYQGVNIARDYGCGRAGMQVTYLSIVAGCVLVRLRFFFFGHFTVVGAPDAIPRLVPPLATVCIVNIARW